MNLFAFKPKVLDFYQTLIADKSGLFSEEQQNFLSVERNELETGQFIIVIAGRFSAGKSLLINRAFLHADILPYKNAPTTCHPVHIVYGEKIGLFYAITKVMSRLLTKMTMLL